MVGYGFFVLGSFLYLLMKMKSYKKQAKNNPNPNLNFSAASFFNDEWINVLMLWLGGIPLVIFLPILIGGTSVSIVNTAGVTVSSFDMKNALAPFEFLVGLGGNSVLFSFFSKYQKTFLNQVGVDSTPTDN